VRFNFNEDHLMFQETVRGFLDKECTAEQVRALWDTDTGRSTERWAKLAELGLLGILVPEEHGGLGMTEVELVLLLEETGRAALPEPVVETAAVCAPLLRDAGAAELADRWLPKIATGEATLTFSHQLNAAVTDAHVADLVLVQHGQELHAVPSSAIKLEPQPCNDLSRRLFSLDWLPGDDTVRIASGTDGAALIGAAFDRAALGVAAQQVGIAQRLVELAVEYARERHQFGKPIGSYQAIKHMLANVQVAIEFARPLLYRAAFSVAAGAPSSSIDVSQAKAEASEAAVLAAKTALQVHGAIGYTWEVDLHLWMKRAWALEAAWGNRLWHRRRIAEAILDRPKAPSFGFTAR